MTAGGCAACLGRWPSPDQHLAELDLSVAYLNEDQFFPGWTVLVLKRHATELFELSAPERAGLIEEVSTVARALAVAFDAMKVNYAFLGNQLPHMHWHLVPRRADDPAPREAIWAVPHESRQLGAAERDARLGAIRAQLGR